MTYTILCFMYRAPGTSLSNYRNWYENTLMPKEREAVGPSNTFNGIDNFPLRHTRRYIHRGDDDKPTLLVGKPQEIGYDCIAELVFKDEEHFGRFAQAASTPKAMELIRGGEEEFMDRSRMVVLVMGEEVVSRAE